MAIDFQSEFGVNAGYVETLFEKWRVDQDQVEPEWRAWFEQLAREADGETAPTAAGARATTRKAPAPATAGTATAERDGKAAPQPPAPPAKESAPDDAPVAERLKGIAARIAINMNESLDVPTAMSVREVPVKVLVENRRFLNAHMEVRALGKASFTHLVAFALVRALKDRVHMTASFEERDGQPFKVTPQHVNLGLAIDLETKSGRSLVVPNVKQAETLGFREFHEAYEDLVRRARDGQLQPADFQGTTVTLSNPGGLGTHMSAPRLMKGQGLIIATGRIGVPTTSVAMSEATLADLAIGPVMTMTSTYDHRVIQGAESGLLLVQIDALLQGAEGFYEEIFRALRVPWQPIRPSSDVHRRHDERHHAEKQAKVWKMITAYRARGCRIADLDPLEYKPDPPASLDPSFYGFTIWDFDREFLCDGLAGKEIMPLRDILLALSETYCRRWTIEYMHIADRRRKHWVRERVEVRRNEPQFDAAARKRLLTKLYEAENFERFLHTRYVGNKRFSLEGADTLIPLLADVIERAAESGVEHVVIGMAHRGRLNVLANILNKSYEQIFSEFEGTLLPVASEGSGDVKYHKGQRGTYTTASGRTVDVYLSANPSHLEAVDPVVCGMVRGLQDEIGDTERRRVLAVLIHGDAAFAGQGVVAETLNMSELPANDCGGTVHVVVNNQIGFTAGPKDLRSTYYCTDMAKGIDAPILHANGDYPESVLKATRVALDFHREFHRDVVIDMVCYRRRGHNEGDEPAYTQPTLYKKIGEHPTVVENYARLQIRRGQLTREETERIGETFNERLREALDSFRASQTEPDADAVSRAVDRTDDDPRDYVSAPSLDTGVDQATLVSIVDQTNAMPKGLVVHPNLLRQLRRREAMVRGEQDVDWGCAEALAFGALLLEGVPIRLNGQDSGRGTFSQRHAVIRDQVTEEDWVPLARLHGEQGGGATFEVHDSLLSEEAALAFEYGYSAMRPTALVLWEAQFGDFVNGAQIPIDQFITTSEAKWRHLSGVTLLLPHGYDGQGPEHSSGRIERFLILCADGNVTVANCSTSAQYFHLLRRQGRSDPKRPLVVFTPKSLLRDRRAASPIGDFAAGRFHAVIGDQRVDAARAKRLLFCSGKVAYDLFDRREKDGADDVAIVRVEQLYPFPRDAFRAALDAFPKATPVWVQEEPRNMGAWAFVLQRCMDLGVAIEYAGRPACSSPATGSYARHLAEQELVVERAFGKA